MEVLALIRKQYLRLRHVFAEGADAAGKLCRALGEHGNCTVEIVRRPHPSADALAGTGLRGGRSSNQALSYTETS